MKKTYNTKALEGFINKAYEELRLTGKTEQTKDCKCAHKRYTLVSSNLKDGLLTDYYKCNKCGGQMVAEVSAK